MNHCALPFTGRYRISEVPDYGADLDEEQEAFVRFDADGLGQFHFGCVSGMMDLSPTTRDGKPAIEWSWEGNDEHHDAAGRGWATLEPDGTISGAICFHLGDEFTFRAQKPPQANPKRKRGVL